MGGAETEMGETTRNVLIEAANWDPVSIARTARRHKLPSEAAKRYERGVDPEIAGRGRLPCRPAHGRPRRRHRRRRRLAHPRTRPRARRSSCRTASSRTSSASSTPRPRCTTRSPRSAASSPPTDDGFAVVPPSWRPDLTGKAELAEEVARLVGYHRIPSVLPVAPPGRGLTRSQRLRRQAADVLAGGGLDRGALVPVRDRRRERRVRQRRRRARGIRAHRERARPERAVPAPLAAARAHRRRAPQPLARPHRPRPLRDRARVPSRGGPHLRLGRPPGRRSRSPSDEVLAALQARHPAAAAASRAC